jgi:hypothetical protein
LFSTFFSLGFFLSSFVIFTSGIDRQNYLQTALYIYIYI